MPSRYFKRRRTYSGYRKTRKAKSRFSKRRTYGRRRVFKRSMYRRYRRFGGRRRRTWSSRALRGTVRYNRPFKGSYTRDRAVARIPIGIGQNAAVTKESPFAAFDVVNLSIDDFLASDGKLTDSFTYFRQARLNKVTFEWIHGYGKSTRPFRTWTQSVSDQGSTQSVVGSTTQQLASFRFWTMNDTKYLTNYVAGTNAITAELPDTYQDLIKQPKGLVRLHSLYGRFPKRSFAPYLFEPSASVRGSTYNNNVYQAKSGRRMGWFSTGEIQPQAYVMRGFSWGYCSLLPFNNLPSTVDGNVVASVPFQLVVSADFSFRIRRASS